MARDLRKLELSESERWTGGGAAAEVNRVVRMYTYRARAAELESIGDGGGGQCLSITI